MAAKVSVSITATTQQNKDKTRTLGYVNPEATNEQLQQMAAAYNALSTKVYQNGEKIVRTDLTDPEPTPPATKKFPNASITLTPAGGTDTYTITVYSESTTAPIVYGKYGATSISTITLSSQGNNQWGIASSLTVSPNQDLQVAINENEEYYSQALTYHVN